jgi:tetratricopeptide (TPR) repeat protein
MGKINNSKRNNDITNRVLFLSLLADTGSLVLLVANYPFYTPRVIALILLGHILAASSAWAGIYCYHKDKYAIGVYGFVVILTLPLLGHYEVFKLLNTGTCSEVPGLFVEYGNHIVPLTGKTDCRHGRKADIENLKQSIEIMPVVEFLEENQDCLKKVALVKSLGKIGDRRAVEILNKLREDPHMDVRYYAGEELARIGEWYGIYSSQLKNNIRDNPDDYESCFQLGLTLLEYSMSGLLGKDSVNEHLLEAKKFLKKSIRLNPRQVEPHLMMGHLHMHLGNYDEAIGYFNGVIDMQGDSMESYRALSECYWNQKNITQFKHCQQKINELSKITRLMMNRQAEQ